MAIDFPNSPTLGQQFTAAGVVWAWDGVKWTPSGLGQAYLPLSGGTLTGPLVLNADPTIPLGAATAEYADKPRYGDNRIINGDMRIDQRNNGASGTAVGYTVDRWVYGSSQSGRGTWQRVNTSLANFPYCLSFTSAGANVPAANDQTIFYQAIEADQIADFAWGSASAQTVTLSFWVRCTLTGTFSGAVQNYAQTRAYPFSYSIPTANTWSNIVITIPGDTSGTWAMYGAAGALFLMFDLGCGSTYRGPANAWAATNYVGVTGAVSIVATNGAQLQITGVKLEVGSVATPFNRQSLAKSLADCQRYFEQGIAMQGFYGLVGTFSYMTTYFAVPKRASPTITYSNPAFGNATAIALNGAMQNCFTSNITVTTANNTWVTATFQANAEL